MSFDAAGDSTNEFRFLASDAAGVGRTGPLPEVRRVSVPIPDGRQLSALRYGGEHEAPEFVLLHGMGLNPHPFDPTVLAPAPSPSTSPAMAARTGARTRRTALTCSPRTSSSRSTRSRRVPWCSSGTRSAP